MTALTKLESSVLELSDGGLHPAAIARRLGCSPTTSANIVSRYGFDLKKDEVERSRMRAQSRALGLAVVLAGGHWPRNPSAKEFLSRFDAAVQELRELDYSIGAIARELRASKPQIEAAIARLALAGLGGGA